MFFAPPKVKSLSRYAEYGAYLTQKHFLIMLAVAITLHMAIITIYSMVPRQEVLKIPVRVLNIKLTSGGSASVHMAAPASMPLARPPAEEHEAPPEPEAQEMKPLHEASAESAMEKALAKKQAKAAAHAAAHSAAVAKWERSQPPAKPSHHEHDTAPESAFTTPKKYVREEEASAKTGRGHAKTGTGNGSEVSGDEGGKEVIERYTQTISQWIKNHQVYARAACGEAAAAGGQCDAKGQVVVRLRIDRDGHILNTSVDKTSGKELVDQAAFAMVSASDPVPSVPSNFPGNQLEFLIAVQVDLSKQ